MSRGDLAWHVADKCDLVGRTLLVPAVVLLGGAQVLAYQAIAATYPTWGDGMVYLLMPAFGLGMILAGRNLLLDS